MQQDILLGNGLINLSKYNMFVAQEQPHFQIIFLYSSYIPVVNINQKSSQKSPNFQLEIQWLHFHKTLKLDFWRPNGSF